jgi:SAM-dependent methyltransferase
MGYILETMSEFDRLEHMSMVRALDPRTEWVDVQVSPGARVLDVGCGSGFVVRYLGRRFPEARIVGTDASAVRVEQARRGAEGIENVVFQVDDILCTAVEPESFDIVHCRLVMEHLGAAAREQAARALYRSVKPGGMLRLVSIDGVVLNIHPTPPLVAELIAAIRAMPGLDLEAGRKVPPLLAALDVEALQVRIEADPFTSDEGCIQVIRAALSSLRGSLVKVVGSEERVGTMLQAYDETLHLPGATAVTNKFIVTCRKPARLSGRA